MERYPFYQLIQSQNNLLTLLISLRDWEGERDREREKKKERDWDRKRERERENKEMYNKLTHYENKEKGECWINWEKYGNNEKEKNREIKS